MLLVANSATFSQDLKPRVVVTTDGEEDSQSSMIRFPFYSNEFDLEAIVSSNSQFHWVGEKGWNALHPVEWIKDYIDLYSQVHKNLINHDRNYSHRNSC